jgi:hypothetical protein
MIVAHLRGNAIAYFALVVALSTGSAYAADQIANGSVTKAKLAKNAVTSPKIKDNAVKSADVKDGSLTTADVGDGSLTGADVKDGSLTDADLAPGVLPEGLTIAAEPNGFDPPASPDLPGIRKLLFTTGGRTYIQFDFNRVGMDCSGTIGFMGLYVDGVPVPGTSYQLPSTAALSHKSLSVVVTPTAGSHTASVGLDCPSGAFQSATHADSNWFVLATQG